MATNVTHAAIGVLFAYAATGSIIEKRISVRLAVAAVVVANLPDFDLIAGLAAHRLFMHGLFFEALIGLAATFLIVRGEKIFSRRWWQLASVLVLAAVSHSVIDALNPSVGPAFFAPFWNEHLKLGLDLIPDVYLLRFSSLGEASWWGELALALRAEMMLLLCLSLPIVTATELRIVRRRPVTAGFGSVSASA